MQSRRHARPDHATLSPPCAAGSATQEEVPAAERTGTLWDYYRTLVEKGWTPDVYHYSTSFRWVSVAEQSTVFLCVRNLP